MKTISEPTQVDIVKLLIDGKFIDSKTSHLVENCNPATQEVLSYVPMCTKDEIEKAVQSSYEAFKSWREVSPSQRVRFFLKFQDLLRKNHDELAELITLEQGKTFSDAKGDVQRGLEVVEYAASIPSMIMGETVENVSRGIDTYSFQQPLGVCAGISPFNFPAMIPLWMFPLAIAAGNTFILKPSEQDPMTPIRIAKLAQEAGLPKGVLNVIHGGPDVVNALCDHPKIRAISFVGSATVGHHVYDRGTSSGKRVQALLGAKNHAIVLPDANKEKSLNAITGAVFGASGQRCMALSVVVLVGESCHWKKDFVEKARCLKVGPGDQDLDFGPLISPRAKEKVCRLIHLGEQEGAELLLDGRDLVISGFEKGNFVGPTIFHKVTTNMTIYQEEIFGPVMIIMEVKNLDEAIQLVNDNPYGNGSAIFTESGKHARQFQRYIEAGMVGINIPIPVPLPFFSFSGAKGSIRGDHHTYGKHGIRFYTQTKTVTTRWLSEDQGINTTIQMG